MSARLSAAFGLATLFAAVALPETSGVPSSHKLLVYVDAGINPAAATLTAMHREAEKLMNTAGYRLEWREARAPRNRETAPDIAFVELIGACAMPAVPASSQPAVADDADSQQLASTAVSDGVVLPFSRIDCAALTNILSPVLLREPPGQRTFFYGRAMGRLLAHELYHVLAQTRDHARDGVGKPCFTSGDLVADRFEFESVALGRLRRPAIGDSAGASTLPATRR